jgi:hypothetical protein
LCGRRSAAVARFHKTAVSAVVLAIVARIVAIDKFERAGVVAEGAEGDGRAGGGVLGWVEAGRVRQFRLPAHFALHAGLFHAPDAHLTPAGDGHVLDEGLLEGGLRFEFFEQKGKEPQKAIRGLAFENDGVGEHAMTRSSSLRFGVSRIRPDRFSAQTMSDGVL